MIQKQRFFTYVEQCGLFAEAIPVTGCWLYYIGRTGYQMLPTLHARNGKESVGMHTLRRVEAQPVGSSQSHPREGEGGGAEGLNRQTET